MHGLLCLFSSTVGRHVDTVLYGLLSDAKTIIRRGPVLEEAIKAGVGLSVESFRRGVFVVLRMQEGMASFKLCSRDRNLLVVAMLSQFQTRFVLIHLPTMT